MNTQRLLACPAGGEGRLDEMYRVIDRWTSSPAMQALVRIFGGRWRSDWSLQERLSFLESFSVRWDFRRGTERLDATRLSLRPEVERAVQEAVAELGLTVASPPMLKSYDYVLVLGGVALSCKLRTEYAAEIVRKMDVQTRAVVLLGASRRIPENERAVADSFAPGSETEFDMLNAAAEAAFHLSRGYDESVTQEDKENLTAVVRRYNVSAPPVIVSLCAPSSDPGRRANSEDTYAFFASTFKLRAGQSVLICTSQVYYPFHTMGAMRMLAIPYDVYVEVVGFPIERATGSAALRGVNNLLQEVRSALQASVRLKQSLDALA
jgi:hypothetical protein